jgi:hypothetical protein
MAVNFASAISITRHNAGSYVAGEWTPAGTPSATVTVNGNVQSASPADKETVARETGFSTDGLVTVRCNEQLLTADKSAAKQADRFVWQGSTYEVVRAVYRGTLPALAHWKCQARLIDALAEDGGL